jgi:hypothetical protein
MYISELGNIRVTEDIGRKSMKESDFYVNIPALEKGNLEIVQLVENHSNLLMGEYIYGNDFKLPFTLTADWCPITDIPWKIIVKLPEKVMEELSEQTWVIFEQVWVNASWEDFMNIKASYFLNLMTDEESVRLDLEDFVEVVLKFVAKDEEDLERMRKILNLGD